MAETARRAFVAGHPIGHSRSPLIHRHWLARYGIDGAYDPVDVAPDDFPAFLDGLAAGGIAGGNVTIPHKEAAFRHVARRDAAADAIGAVNTVWLEDGTLVGGNTDAYGFAANLDDRMPCWREAERALVLGAGGAARAILHALREAGITDIRLANRTRTRAQELAQGFGPNVSVAEWQALDDAAAEAGLVVNTTSLGMKGEGRIDLAMDRLSPDAIVTDIVYVPLRTPLLCAAGQAGLATVDGLGMLLHQAVPGFEKWFGVRPQVTEELRALVVADLGEGA